MDECRSRVLETVAPLSAETVAQRMSDYLKLMDAGGVTVRGCAACGVLAFDSVEVALEKVARLKLDDDARDRYEAHPCAGLLSVTLVGNAHGDVDCYHLHRRNMRQAHNGSVLVSLCAPCNASLVKNVLPRYSIANGYDFGNPEALGLPALSVAEQMLIGRCHPYKRILKLVGGQEALSGHTVCLEHDGSHVLAASLPRLSLGDQLVVAFVGTEEQWRRATVSA